MEPTERRRFHNRPFQVIDGERFAKSLEATFTTPALRGLPPGIGAVWQLSDAVDLLSDVGRCRAIYGAILKDAGGGSPSAG